MVKDVIYELAFHMAHMAADLFTSSHEPPGVCAHGWAIHHRFMGSKWVCSPYALVCGQMPARHSLFISLFLSLSPSLPLSLSLSSVSIHLKCTKQGK